MPDYEVVTPLSNGRKKPIPPGTIVSLREAQGDKLVAIGALKPVPTLAKSPAPKPAPTPTPTPTPTPAPAASPAAAKPKAPMKPKAAPKPKAQKA
ncbi:hypothetical protein SPYCA_2689 [Sphingopyxis sp. FD7]|nr:hypothetical protein SPYCA_2689 [Sphingopyxis sp. FD7]